MITASTATAIRHPHQGEHIPEAAWPSFAACIDPEWAWVAVDEDDRVVATLLTAPAHGLVMLLRLWAAPGTSPHWLRKLLRQGAKECYARGQRVWVVMLMAGSSTELRLARLALHHKGTPTSFQGFVYAGSLEDVCRHS